MSVLDNFRKKFFAKNEGAVILLSPDNRFYFTGIETSDGVVVITSDRAFFLVDFRYYEVAKNTVRDFDVLLAKKSLLAEAGEILKSLHINNIFIEDDYVTLSLYRRMKSVLNDISVSKISDFLTVMRGTKTEEEIQKIVNSQKLTDAAFEHLLSILNVNMTENDVALELDYFMRKNGAQASAFKTIAVSGKNSSLPHGEPSDIKLTKNSFLTLDFGARLDGYCSDMTRTVVIGKADEEMKHIYNIVLEAQLSALSEIRAGVIGSKVDAAARDIISDAGYGDCFGHATGHGIGIEVHEHPAFSSRFDKEICENSVLSVEPGIYIEGKYGVRIEDIVVVRKESAQNLTLSNKNLIEI